MSSYRIKGASGRTAGQSFDIGTELLIGSASECQVQVHEPGVRPRHASIRLQPDGSLLLSSDQPAAASGIWVNGQQLGQAELGSGDEIRIGTSRFVLQAPGLRPDRVLTEQAISPRRRWWPWVLLTVTVLAASAGFAWQRGWLVF